MKRIVISGGTGLIGRMLVDGLAAAGHQVIILSRSPDKHGSGFPASVKLVSWDPQTIGEWVKEIDGSDVVINLAGESIGGENFLPDRWTSEKRQRIHSSRLDISRAIVQAVEKAANKPEVLLQASAIGYYGPHGDEWVDETHEPGSDFLAAVVVDWENGSSAVENMGVRRVLMRTGLVLTTAGGPLTRMMVPFKLFAGGKYGSGRQYYSWIHMADLIEAMVFVINNQQISGPINLVSPNPVTNKNFAMVLGQAMNRPSLIPVPTFAMKMLTGAASTLVLDGQRVSSKHLQEEGFFFQFPELDAALQDLIHNAS